MIFPMVRAVPVASSMLFAMGVVAFSPFVADDAYIVGRYALNVADGHGLVYNLGERVSALTSPLHALLLSLVALVTDDPVTSYRFLAPVLPALGVVAALRILRANPTEAALITVFGLASPFMAMWSVGGLETPILTAIVTVWAAILLKMYRTREIVLRDGLILGALAGLAFVTRHDSVLVTLPPLLAVALVAWRNRAVWAGAALAMCVAGSWLAFAYLYYGDVLPTSFYTKMISDRGPAAVSMMVAINFTLLSGLIFMVPLLSFRRPDCHPFGRALVLGVICGVAAFSLFALKNAGMHMMFGYRYFVPYLPTIGILLAASLWRLRQVLPPVLLAGQGALGIYMVGHSINPYLVEVIPGIGRGQFEYATMTPRDYATFMATLEADARDLNAHWAATERPGEPVIGMHTGGMGYWLRDFRVVEILVSYRHDCRMPYDDVVAIPDYVQGINFVRHAGRLRASFLGGAQDVEILSRSEFDAGMAWAIDYAYRTNGAPYVYPPQINGACMASGSQMANATRR